MKILFITDNYYPENNLIVSEPMVFRDIVVKQITFFPYRLDVVNNSIQIYDDVNIEVEEIVNANNRESGHTKISRTFEPLYKDLIINYSSFFLLFFEIPTIAGLTNLSCKR